jgi:SAM-dependent methyltransferase
MTDPDRGRETWNARYRELPLVWSAGPNQFVVEQTGSLPPGRALDVACGEGRNALWLAERGWTVTGVDFSDVAIAKAQASARERGLSIDFRVGDVTDGRTFDSDGELDLVLVAYLQLPDEELEATHRALVDHVAPGGLLLVIGHHADNLARGYGGPSKPDVLHDPARIAAQLAPLTVVSAGEVERIVATEGGERTAVDSLVLARRSA